MKVNKKKMAFTYNWDVHYGEKTIHQVPSYQKKSDRLQLGNNYK